MTVLLHATNEISTTKTLKNYSQKNRPVESQDIAFQIWLFSLQFFGHSLYNRTHTVYKDITLILMHVGLVNEFPGSYFCFLQLVLGHVRLIVQNMCRNISFERFGNKRHI